MKNLFDNNSGAEFSPCGKYRYQLWRIWDESKPLAMCIGLNPSTANSATNDPTIGILTRMLSKLGYGGFYMMNLFTIISSDPKILLDPNIESEGGARYWIHNTKDKCQDIIFAWGNFEQAKGRSSELGAQFPQAKCFGKNANGSPFHPLAMMYNGKQKNPELIPFIKK